MKKIISEYYQFSDLSNAINDLNWCIFIIANDYLKESGSGSGKPIAGESKEKGDDVVDYNADRRLSKAKNANDKLNQIQAHVINKLWALAENVVLGN